MTDVHAEHEQRRVGEPYEAGYQEGYKEAAYQRTGGETDEYEPSDTGYDPAVDGPDDVSARDDLLTAGPVTDSGTDGRYAETADVEEPATAGAYGDGTPASERAVNADAVDDDVVDADAVDADAVDADAADADVVDADVVDAEVVDETPVDADAEPASATTASGGPEGALPEDVTAADTAAVAGTTAATDPGAPSELVEDPDALMARWQEVQVSFVDDPRDSLRAADALVQQVIEDMQQRFVNERTSMEQQWSAGEADTEDMRVLLQKYRTFFNRLIRV